MYSVKVILKNLNNDDVYYVFQHPAYLKLFIFSWYLSRRFMNVIGVRQ